MRLFRRCLGVALCCAGIAYLPPYLAAEGAYAAPDFSGLWSRTGNVRGSFDPVPGYEGAGPIMIDPRYPRSQPPPGEEEGVIAVVSGWVPDLTNPILLPHTREALSVIAQNEINDYPHPQNQTLCRPPGVPHILNLFDSMTVLQGPHHVAFMYSRDHHVRHVYLNQPHSENLGHSWWGESVGHYEGDTLVVDTIGLMDGAETDRFGTPHSDRMHVVERYRLSDDGSILEVELTIEDHGAFAVPWKARADYEPDDWMWLETICAENHRQSWPGREMEIPIDYSPDF
jgi:hypothetical protein